MAIKNPKVECFNCGLMLDTAVATGSDAHPYEPSFNKPEFVESAMSVDYDLECPVCNIKLKTVPVIGGYKTVPANMFTY